MVCPDPAPAPVIVTSLRGRLGGKNRVDRSGWLGSPKEMSLSRELKSGHFRVESTLQTIRHSPLADDLEKRAGWSVFSSLSVCPPDG